MVNLIEVRVEALVTTKSTRAKCAMIRRHTWAEHIWFRLEHTDSLDVRTRAVQLAKVYLWRGPQEQCTILDAYYRSNCTESFKKSQFAIYKRSI